MNVTRASLERVWRESKFSLTIRTCNLWRTNDIVTQILCNLKKRSTIQYVKSIGESVHQGGRLVSWPHLNKYDVDWKQTLGLDKKR